MSQSRLTIVSHCVGPRGDLRYLTSPNPDTGQTPALNGLGLNIRQGKQQEQQPQEDEADEPPRKKLKSKGKETEVPEDTPEAIPDPPEDASMMGSPAPANGQI